MRIAIRKSVCIVALTLTGCGGPPRDDVYDLQMIRAAEVATWSLDEVSARAIGISDSPGAFYSISKLWLRHGTGGDYRMMANSDDAVTRAMGIVCMAARYPNEAVPLLTDRIHNTHYSFTCFPRSCVGWTMTESEFAVRMLTQPGFASEFTDGPPEPLLGGDAYLSMCLRLLGVENMAWYHAELSGYASEMLRSSPQTQSFDVIARRCEPMHRQYVLVGLARMDPSARRDEILIRVLRDPEVGRGERLAAASGLSRNPDESVGAILNEVHAAGGLGGIERVIESWSVRRRLAAVLGYELSRSALEDTRDERERRRADAALRLADGEPIGHPTAIRLIVDAIEAVNAPLFEYDEAKRARFYRWAAESLVLMGDHVEERWPWWDTDSDLAWVAWHRIVDAGWMYSSEIATALGRERFTEWADRIHNRVGATEPDGEDWWWRTDEWWERQAELDDE